MSMSSIAAMAGRVMSFGPCLAARCVFSTVAGGHCGAVAATADVDVELVGGGAAVVGGVVTTGEGTAAAERTTTRGAGVGRAGATARTTRTGACSGRRNT